jgi:peptide/nickel transport system ATP-binding protein
MALIEVADLTVGYAGEQGVFRAVRDASFALERGEVLGVVGESGSGKSTLALAVMGWRAPGTVIPSGRVTFDGVSLLDSSPAALRRIWGRRIAMVHQNPLAALTPTMTVGAQIAETIRQHRDLDAAALRDAVRASLRAVNLPDPDAIARRYPHELSGGQRQRIVIAIALSLEPDLLILDEPTTSLDATTEAVILDLLEEIKGRVGAAMIYISHNLGVIARIATRVAVMYAGEFVETGTVRSIFAAPAHHYTRALLDCLPRPQMTKRHGRLEAIPGGLPAADRREQGCVFAERCAARDALCNTRPDWSATSGHRWRCWHPVAAIEQAKATRPATTARPAAETVLAVEALSKTFPGGGKHGVVRAVNAAGLTVKRAAVVGLVGESGSGKSTMLRCIAGLETGDAGRMAYLGIDLPPQASGRARATMQDLQMVFQDPESTLNPAVTVGGNLQRHLVALRRSASDDVRARVAAALGQVQLPAAYAERYPHELSGGEKQRVAIARAFLSEPRLVLCDEPLSALDVSVQSAICQLLLDLQHQGQASYVFVSHDLSIVRYMADTIVVMYLGEVVEEGSAESFDRLPMHPYTEALFSAIPLPDPAQRRQRVRLIGQPSESDKHGAGCIFSARCPRKKGPECDGIKPPWQSLDGRRYACHWQPDDLRRLQEAPGTATAMMIGGR